MKITVTQEHINKGKHCECNFCPIALALKEQFSTDYVVVSPTYFSINGKRYNATKVMRKFIRDFDFCKPVKPHTFIIKGN